MKSAADPRQVTMIVNGTESSAVAEPRLTLADFLRHKLFLTGTHLGCEHGVCGACTVLVDGLAVRGCLMLAVQAQGRTVGTIEGLAASDEGQALQQAFAENHGLQCGYCTPGILMTLTQFLQEVPDPTETQMREAISGNLCRCTGYQNIVQAGLSAAAAIREMRNTSVRLAS